MPVPSMVTTCIRFGYSTISVRTLTLLSLNLSTPCAASHADVGHRERDFGLAGVDELQVVDRAAGDFGRGLQARDVLRQDVGHAAAQRVVHAAGAAGGDRDAVALLGRRGRRDRECGRRESRKRGAQAQWSIESSRWTWFTTSGSRREDFAVPLCAPSSTGEVYRNSRAVLTRRRAGRAATGGRRSSADTRTGKRAELAIEEEVAQRPRDRAERERLPRDFGLVEQAHLEALGAGTEIEIEQARAKHHVDLVDLRQADHRVELADVDARVALPRASRAARRRPRVSPFSRKPAGSVHSP